MGYLDIRLEDVVLPPKSEVAQGSCWFCEVVPGIGVCMRNENTFQYGVFVDKQQLARINALIRRKQRRSFSYEGHMGQALTGYQIVDSDRWVFETMEREAFDVMRREISTEIRDIMAKVMDPKLEVDATPKVWVQPLDMPAFADMKYHDLRFEYDEVKEALVAQVAKVMDTALPIMKNKLSAAKLPQDVCIVIDAANEKLQFFMGKDGEDTDALFYEGVLGKQAALLAEIMKYLPALHREYLEEFLPTQEDLLDEDSEDPYHEIPGIIEDTLSEYEDLSDDLIFDAITAEFCNNEEVLFWADIASIYDPDAAALS